MTTDLSRESIESALSGRWGRPLTYLDSTDSTNERALELLREGAPEGALVVADHQTSGRGRRGRTWESPAGSGLLFSLVLRPDSSEGLEILTTAVGVAVAESLEETTGVETQVKWPNDVVAGGRKLAGVLVESRLSSSAIEGTVAGVGLNVSWPADEGDAQELKATSLVLLHEIDSSVHVPGRAALLAAVVRKFEDVYAILSSRDGRADVVERATERSSVLGRDVVVRFGDGSSLEGEAVALTPSGGLTVETARRRETLRVGEIEQLRAR